MSNGDSGKELTQRWRNAFLSAPTAIGYTTGTKGTATVLTKEQIQNWEHFKIADKICERARRGLPQDRWMRGNHEMYAMVKAYMDMVDMVKNMHDDMIQKGLDAMDIE